MIEPISIEIKILNVINMVPRVTGLKQQQLFFHVPLKVLLVA